MRYDFARHLAIDCCERLKPFCEVINIVGSLRRRLPEISDIDIMCVPRHIESAVHDLFGKIVHIKKISVGFSNAIQSLGTITKGKPDGHYMSLKINGYKVDIFMPAPADYWRQYCIRTGSAEYVRYNIAAAWAKKGWCGTDQGLRRIYDCREIASVLEKKKWEVVNPNGEQPPAWESEEQFFEWLGIKWIHPRFRTI